MKWEDLPEELKCGEVRPYYLIIRKRFLTRIIKRGFDISASVFLIITLLPIMFFIALFIRCDSYGPAIYRSRRITRYKKSFTMYKFRTMQIHKRKKGGELTLLEDSRITRVGKWLRPLRLDELPQLFNVLLGQMSFVGARPEDPRFVEHYTPEMMATLLLPAGITSRASILFKNEDKILANLKQKGYSTEKAYLTEILPEKMKHNLNYLKRFSIKEDISLCFKTLFHKK